MTDWKEIATYHGCKVVKETEKAINVEATKGVFKQRDNGYRSRFAWLPKSVIHDDSEIWEEGQEGKLVVPNWFAEKENWA